MKKHEPGIVLRLFGPTSIIPTVARPSSTDSPIRLTSVTMLAAATSASCRRPIGVVPACASCPVSVTSYQRCACAPCTTPIVFAAPSRIGPCSMCAST